MSDSIIIAIILKVDKKVVFFVSINYTYILSLEYTLISKAYQFKIPCFTINSNTHILCNESRKAK